MCLPGPAYDRAPLRDRLAGDPPSKGHRQRPAAGLDRCVFITAVPITKLFAWGEPEGDSGGYLDRRTCATSVWESVF